MNKEPTFFLVLRFLVKLSLPIILGMLYWSLTLIEDRLQKIDREIENLKDLSIQPKQLNIEKTKNNIDTTETSLFPNLLQTDPFFKITLPNLLGKNFIPHGTRHEAEAMRPDNLHPFSGFAVVSSWNNMCLTSLSQSVFGIYESMSPNMAWKIEERENPITKVNDFWVFLRKDCYWQPLKPDFFSNNIKLAPQFLKKTQVTAEDYKFYYDAMMNPSVQELGAVALRSYYQAIEEIKVIDPFTFVVRWKSDLIKDDDGTIVPKIKYVAKLLTGGLKPLPSIVYKYFHNGKKIIEDDFKEDTYRTSSIWGQNFMEHWAKNVIVSCGPWIFDGMNDRQIQFKRNPDYYNPLAALTTRYEIDFKESPNNIWQAFKAGQLDSCLLRPEQHSELQTFMQSEAYENQAKNGHGIKQLDYVAMLNTCIGWNQAKPYFKSSKVRTALTMAIDRHRIIQQNLNGKGIEISCQCYRYSPAYDESIIPLKFSPQQSKRLLEQEGWFDHDGDGIIDQLIDGQITPFRFSLTYYVKNPTTKAICEYVSLALKEIGIDCQLKGVDMADFSAELEDHNADAFIMSWTFGSPPEDLRQLWHSSGADEKGSSNLIGFKNKEVDSIIDKLDYEYDQKKRIALYHRFDAIFHEEQPYTLLYEPISQLLYREYLQNVFIPQERQDLIPGANVAEPDLSVSWINN